MQRAALADGSPALTRAEVEPEEVKTWEPGLKTVSFDRRLTANLATYDTAIADFQANVVDAGLGALRGSLANVEKVEIKGVERDLSARPTDNLDPFANVARINGAYASFANGPCPLERSGPSTAACDLSGAERPGVSPWAGRSAANTAGGSSAAGAILLEADTS